MKKNLNYKAVITDIEGTTTPVSFVYNTLFPYSKIHLKEILDLKDSISEIENAIQELRLEYTQELVNTSLPDFEDGYPYIMYLIEMDRKSTGLKSIQGLIWKNGFESGELKGDVYRDVADMFLKWAENDISINIYSSGSVLSQKLIFKYSNKGDLSEYIQGYFDTNTGSKKSKSSYEKIASTIQTKPEDILFLSDVTEELIAAEESGLQTGLLVRPGNKPIEKDHKFNVYTSFYDLF